jgi:HD-like signal output (HDOD) protein
LPARDAATLMLGVLDALGAAPAQGIVHRDLKPSNILLSRDGRPRVLDFGIAARTAGHADAGIAGTPGYIAPEAVRGAPPAPAMDVFAAGMLLGELLAGAPLLRETDPARALARVQAEDFGVPATLAIDDTLRAIVARAAARDPLRRYDSAEAMRAALTAWLQPADSGDPPDASAGGHGTLDFLLRRMRVKRDFPALGASIVRIQRVASSETESVDRLAAEILKDVALTNKLLRMVNTVHFASAGGGISTVSRAVALVGFAGIRNMALSVLLLEHMNDAGHATQVKEGFLRALMAGTLAAELSATPRDAEEAFIGTLFQDLGRLLVDYYFPDEARQVRDLAPAGDRAALETASVQVLGLGFGALGLGVARRWGLPESLQRVMSPPEGPPPARVLERGAERQRWTGRLAHEVTDALLAPDAGAAAARIDRLAARHAGALGLPASAVHQATDRARERVAQLAGALGLQVGSQSPARRLLGTPAAISPPGPTDSLAPHRLAATLPMAPTVASTVVIASPTVPLGTAAADVDVDVDLGGAAHVNAPPSPSRASVLAAGVQDITDVLATESPQLNQILRMVLETMYRALALQRVVLCLRDAKRDALTARFGLGEGVDALRTHFVVPLRPAPDIPPDLFGAVCAKGVDTLIADASTPAIAARLPRWFGNHVAAPSFLLLPLVMKGATFALIYADQSRPNGIALQDNELALLRTLRNQALMAFRQAERG